MGRFAPVFLAYILNCFGVNIFREATPGCEPLISCLIFLTAVFFLLWDMKLYPASLRKPLSKFGAFVIEFLTVAFLMEHIMTDFWFPLESSLMALLPRIAAAEEDLLKQGGWQSGGIFTPLTYNGTQVVASYVLSLFFLFAVLHATRVIDLRLLTNCGPGVFLRDIAQKFNKLKKKMMKIVVRRRQVKFRLNCKSSRSKSFASSHGSSDFDDCDCNCTFDDTDEDDLCNEDNNFEENDCISYSRSRKY